MADNPSSKSALMPANSFPAGASPYHALNLTGNVWEYVDELRTPSDAAVKHYATIMNPTPTAREPWYIIKGGSFDRNSPMASPTSGVLSRPATSKRTSASAAPKRRRVFSEQECPQPMTDTAKSELIERQRSPLNLESPLAALSENFLTPNHLFYVRNHFPIPVIPAADWQLRVEGAVERPQTIPHDQLRHWPRQELTVTLECAGNHRSVLRPKAKGVAWDRGASAPLAGRVFRCARFSLRAASLPLPSR